MRPSVRQPLTLPAAPPLAVPEGFAQRLAEVGVRVVPRTLDALGAYLARLLAMNERMSLTAIEQPAAAWERHAFDALTLLPLLDELGQGARLVDVGSGGGVPGIPLAIARPDLHVTLIEATQKKAAFLAALAVAMQLPRVVVRPARAEHLARGPLGGGFDAVTARAVARLAVLVPLTAPFARPGGRVLLIKGARAADELADAAVALRAQRVTHEATVATPTGRIVVLRKDPG